MQTLEKKKFVLYHTPEFVGGEKVQLVVGMEFLEGGFRPQQISDITDMKPTDTLTIDSLMIWRVK